MTGKKALYIAATAIFISTLPLAAESFEWKTASPEQCGFDSLKLAAAVDTLAARRTQALLVVRRDRIVCEWYGNGLAPGGRHYTASLAKALVGGMSLLLALDDNRLRPDDPAWRYIPFWKDDPLRSLITVRHLATHSSGIEDAETPGLTHFEQQGWKLRFWNQDPDPFSMSVRQAPVIYEPGHRFHYSNPGMGALSYTVTSSYRATEWKDLRTLLRKRVMEPIGVAEKDYSLGYDQTFQVEGLELVPNWGGGSYAARAVARVGRLLLRRGDWEGRQLIGSAWVDSVTSYAGTPLPPRFEDDAEPGSGLGFYANFDGVWANLPRDAIAGAGAGNQVLVVIPSLELIVVRFGELLDGSDQSKFWGGLERWLFDPLMEALVRPPYPKSTSIDSIVFEPAENIVSQAVDSDNWPVTWAADGQLYTAYGDGWGFDPRTEKKLSNGLARISGGGADFRGENIRTPSGETIGDGAEGAKASGLLSVGGKLYMWMRNTGNSQLFTSRDQGVSWQKGFKFTESFGCPAFLNFGRDYAGARDGYIYIYSQDGPSAYENYDRVALARVPIGRIEEREAYEFFSGLDASGGPTWSSDIAQRAGAFEFPGHCHRLDVVYDPGLGRYLLALASGHRGGWGIYEAPEPWGPWRTAFFTDYWGLGDTHGYRIPSKWIAADGKSFYLVFSGRPFEDTSYDAFCVRRARIVTGGK
ncbi:MAG TPA: serine hydrolase [Candidatus Glassbacteria bacterium]|nr:serine hydrolase [Candidatus Glassbacteria bacterium]